MTRTTTTSSNRPEKGSLVHIRGLRGSFRVIDPDGLAGSIKCWGPLNARARMRSFKPEQITKIEKPKETR